MKVRAGQGAFDRPLKLRQIQINYNIAEVLSPTGFVTVGQYILRSGGALVSTTGLEFIDFSFANLLLESGKSYHINFQFTGNSNQNFFRDEPFPPGWTQGAFSGLDATEGGHTDNAAIAGIHVNIVPEPIFASVAAVGAVTLAMSRRR